MSPMPSQDVEYLAGSVTQSNGLEATVKQPMLPQFEQALSGFLYRPEI